MLLCTHQTLISGINLTYSSGTDGGVGDCGDNSAIGILWSRVTAQHWSVIVPFG